MGIKNVLYRRILVLLAISAITLSSVLGQVPNGMKYQAVVRDNLGRIIESKTVGVQIRIVQYVTDGDDVFVEEHQKTTNEYGLIYLVIGSENEQGFETIDWSDGPYFIEVGIDIDGGVNYEPYGTSELLSVPYALYALHAASADNTITTSDCMPFVANVVCDYDAVGDGINDNSDAFIMALEENNDIFVPASDQSYRITELHIPQGKRIWFEQGAILDISGTLTGDNTEIIAGDYQLFTSNSKIAGTWRSGIAYDSWLSNTEIPGMSAMVTAADTTRWGMNIKVSDSAYSENWDGSLEAASKNAIYDKIQSINIEGGSTFIANVVDDYEATGDGTSDDALAFANALNENNDVFIPYSENNYSISNLVIPAGKRLWFEAGAVLDINGALTGEYTEIVAGDYQIFTATSVINGTWKSGIAYDGWLANNEQLPGMSAMVTAADTTRWATQTEVSDSAFSANWDGSLEAASKNAIYDKIQSINIEGGSSFIANVVDDYAAVGDGATDNAQTFSNALSENNDIFIPYSENPYLISNLTIPSGKRLWFEAGAMLDVSSNLTGDSTEIIAGDYQLFTASSAISGTWKSGIAYDGWLANNEQLPGMSAMITAADTTRWATQTEVSDSAFSANWDGSLEAASKNAIYDKIQSINIEGGSSFIANVVDDYAAVGDGATDNAQAFSNALSENNDIFIPYSENPYLISNLTIPSGKRLWFEGGAMLDVSSNLTGDSTEIIAGDYQLFTASSAISGTWKSGIAYDGWLANNEQLPGMSAMVTAADTTRWAMQTEVSDSAFSANWDGSLEAASKNAIYDKIQSINIEGGSSFIANVVDDYAAVGDGATDNAQAFSNALSENNDIFIPYSENTYLISNLIIPSGKRLWFEAGAMLDISNSLTGDSTEIVAGNYQLFSNTSILSGTWKSAISYDAWSGLNSQIPGMIAMVTPADTTRWGMQTVVSDSAFSANWDGNLDAPSKNAIYDKIQSINVQGGATFIANVVDDYAAVADGMTDNTTAFNNALMENHEIFVPAGDSTYKITSLMVPPGKRIWFESDAKLEVTGSLTGDSTEIIAGDYQLFTSSSTLNGTWKGGISYDSWSGKSEQIPGMSAMITPADTARWNIDTYGSGSFIANVIDYGAVANGVTDNAQFFADAFQENNDLFIPKGDSTYLVSSMTIPKGKRLWFETDSKIDVTGVLTGDSTEIMAGDQQLFTSTSTLEGSWKGGISYNSWSGNDDQIPGMIAMVTPADTARWGIDTYGSGSFIANVIDYGAVGDGSTNDSVAFSQAFAENNGVFVPNTGYNYKVSKLTIPEGKQIWFEPGAVLDVSEEMIIEGEIIAGQHQIFTLNSSSNIKAKNAIVDRVYGEWFGAKADSSTQSADAIQACIDVFQKVDLMANGNYFVNKTINLLEEDLYDGVYPYYGRDIYSVYMDKNTAITVDMAASDDALFYITAQPVSIVGGSIYVVSGYTGWIYDIHPHPSNNSADWRFRIGSTFKDTKMLGVSYGQDDQNGIAFNGIKIESDEAEDYSYFSTFDNILMRRCDTAIWGKGNDPVNGMLNSYQFSNITIDGSARGIHQDRDCAGWVFSNLEYQQNTAAPYPAITCYSHYNTYQGMAWDFQPNEPIAVFEDEAVNNKVEMGYYDMATYIEDNSSSRRNLWNGMSFKNFEMYNAPDYGVKLNIIDNNQPTLYFQLNGSTKMQFLQDGGLNYLQPSANLGVNLGRSTRRWKTIYTSNISDDGDKVTIDKVLKLNPRSTAPSNPTEGMLYVNSSNHHIYCYLGGSWRQID